jgi:arsenate reductase (glutaredoxin)
MIHSMNTVAHPFPLSVYGIPHCESVKKARAFFTAHACDYVFHDFKKEGVHPEQCALWAQQLGWEKLLNRKGTTWRKLDSATQSSVTDAASAIALMCAHPSVIKRPVVVWHPDCVTVGFDADTFEHNTRTTVP